MAPGPCPEAHYHTLWCDLRPQAHRHPFQARCPSGGRRGPGQSQTFLGRVRGGPPGLRAGPPHSHPAAVSTRWEGVGVKVGSTRGLSKGASGRRGGWRVGAAWRGRWGWSRGSEVGKPRGRRGPGLPLEIAARALLREIRSLQHTGSRMAETDGRVPPARTRGPGRRQPYVSGW